MCEITRSVTVTLQTQQHHESLPVLLPERTTVSTRAPQLHGRCRSVSGHIQGLPLPADTEQVSNGLQAMRLRDNLQLSVECQPEIAQHIGLIH